MIEATILSRQEPAINPFRISQDAWKISQQEMRRVLERAAVDRGFIAQLTDDGDRALRDYRLIWQDEAALLSGDIRWVESRLSQLGPRLRTWLECRLQQEKW